MTKSAKKSVLRTWFSTDFFFFRWTWGTCITMDMAWRKTGRSRENFTERRQKRANMANFCFKNLRMRWRIWTKLTTRINLANKLGAYAQCKEFLMWELFWVLRRTIQLAVHMRQRVRSLGIRNRRPVAERCSRHVATLLGEETLSWSGKMIVITGFSSLADVMEGRLSETASVSTAIKRSTLFSGHFL